MNLSDVAEVEQLSEPELSHHADIYTPVGSGLGHAHFRFKSR